MTSDNDIAVQLPERVGFFLPSLFGGGAERVAVNLARGFVERGVAVDMVLGLAAGPYLDDLHRDVRVVDLDSKQVLLSLPALSGYLRRVRPNALIGFMDHCNLIAMAARALSGAPTRIIGTVHNNKTIQREQISSVKLRVVMALARRAYSRLDALVAVSRGVAESVTRESGVPPHDITTIYNPIVTPELIERARASAPGGGGDGLIVGVGRLDTQKDFPTLIRAFARARSQRPVRLAILGEGPDRESLEALAAELGVEADVVLPGFVDNPYAWLAGAAVFVLSSRWEGLPTVLVEALACGCPVVSTDCPSGPDEILDGGRYGRLVPVGDAEALAAAIVATVDAPPDRDALRARGRDFSLEGSVDAYLALCAARGSA